MSAPEFDDGGPAYPIAGTTHNTATGEVQTHQAWNSGLTIRDFFAAHAIVGCTVSSNESYEEDARRAYRLADAMIAARKEANP